MHSYIAIIMAKHACNILLGEIGKVCRTFGVMTCYIAPILNFKIASYV